MTPSPAERPADRRAARLHRPALPHARRRFDSLADAGDVVRAAAARGLTHLAITDHDRIDGALAAREAAAPRRA